MHVSAYRRLTGEVGRLARLAATEATPDGRRGALASLRGLTAELQGAVCAGCSQADVQHAWSTLERARTLLVASERPTEMQP